MEMIYDRQSFIFSSPEQTGRGADPRVEPQDPNPGLPTNSAPAGQRRLPLNKGTACGNGSNHLFD